MFKGIIRILISYSLIIFFLLLSISLDSFSPNDLWFYTTSPNMPPLNTLGSFGTYISTPFVFFYGKASWIWSMFSLFIGIRLLTGITPKDLLIRFSLTHYLSLMLATFFSLWDSSSFFLNGGVFGALLANQLTAILPNIIWIPFIAFAFILGFFGFFHFPHVLLQKMVSVFADRLQSQKLVAENIPIDKFDSITQEQNFVAYDDIENNTKNMVIGASYSDEELVDINSSESEEQGFFYQKQVPSFLQEINTEKIQGFDDQDDIPIYFTKKRITKPDPFMFREIEVDLLAPYFRSQNPFYKQLEENQENNQEDVYQPKVEVLQDTTEGLDELEQSSELMLPTNELIHEVGVDVADLMNHKHPATRLSFSQGFIEEELEVDDVPIYLKKDTEQKDDTTVNDTSFRDTENKDIEQNIQENTILSVPQHISNFPPMESFTKDPLILKELDEEGNEIENVKIPFVCGTISTPIVTDQLSDSEKILVQGLERTTLRNKNKMQLLKEKLNKKHQELANIYHQIPQVTTEPFNVSDYKGIEPKQTNQDIQDSLKHHSLEQEIMELKKESSFGTTISQAIEDGSFLKQQQEYSLNILADTPNVTDELGVNDDILNQDSGDLSVSDISTMDLLQELMLPVVVEDILSAVPDEISQETDLLADLYNLDPLKEDMDTVIESLEEDNRIEDILLAVPDEISQETDPLADLYNLDSLKEDMELAIESLEEDLPIAIDKILKEDFFTENIDNPVLQATIDSNDKNKAIDLENPLEEDLYIDFDNIVPQEFADAETIQDDNVIGQNNLNSTREDSESLDELSPNSQNIPMAITVEDIEPSFSFLDGVISSRQVKATGYPPFSTLDREPQVIKEELIVIDNSDDIEWKTRNNREMYHKPINSPLSNDIYSDNKNNSPIEENFLEIEDFIEILNLDKESDILAEYVDYSNENVLSEEPKKENNIENFTNFMNSDEENDILTERIDYSDEDVLSEDPKEENNIEDFTDILNLDKESDILAEPIDYSDESFISEELTEKKLTIENFTDILNLNNEVNVTVVEPLNSVEDEEIFAIPIDPNNEIEEIFTNTDTTIANTIAHTPMPIKDIDDLQKPESLLMPSVTTDSHLVNAISYPFAEDNEIMKLAKGIQTKEDSLKEEPNTLIFPRIEDLEPNTDHISQAEEDSELEATMKMIEDTYESFNINMQVVDYNRGPTITRFELEPPSGLKLRTILNLQDDLALQAGTSNLRIISPVEGRSLIGIEVPNKVRRNFLLREQIESNLFQNSNAALPLILGVDVGGKEIVGDLATTPHLLIAGTTGSGKSVYVNALIMGLLFKLSSQDLKFIMIDPKMVELELYSGIPHLLAPIITKPEEAMAALDWAVQEMDRRYKLLSNYGVRNIKEYQDLIANTPIGAETYEKLPYIVIIVDEFASLMLRAPKDTEKYISRLASMSRAVGIHLVLATQRPSVDVVTGVIKANFPSRIAFRVSSKIDSRTIVDRNGAETLLGRGDMLFMSPLHMDLIRIQSPYASSEDIARAVSTVKKNGPPNYTIDFSEVLARQEESSSDGSRTDALNDPLFEEVLRYAVDNGEISASGIQRRFRVGYNRASRLIESMKDMKIISPPPSAGKGWLINITRDEIIDYID